MTESTEFVDASGLVAPDVWPYRPGKLGLAWAEQMSVRIGRIGEATRVVAQELSATWRGLSEPRVYGSPEAHLLRGAMGPVIRDGLFEAEVCQTAGKAVDEFIEDVTALDPRLRNAEADALVFRDAVSGGVVVAVEELPFVKVRGLVPASPFGTTTPVGATFETLNWQEHRPSVERNQELIAQIAMITRQIRDAEAQLAKRLELVDDVGGRGRAPLNLDRVDALGARARGGFVPDPEWFGRASDREFLEWWEGLAPWEREAARKAIEAMDLDAAVIGERLADALRDVAERPDGYDDVATLDAMLDLFGADETVMEHALVAVGIAGLSAALNGVTRETGHYEATARRREQKLRIVSGLRASLSEISAGWDMAQAREFAAERDLDDMGWYTRPELGYLFADPYDAPMGESLTLVMADQLDRLERADLEGPAAQARSFYSPVIELLESAGQDDVERINDPTARVLGTLGQYPDAALEWLTDDRIDKWEPGKTLGEARLKYFYGVRDSAFSGDGFEGVSALWRGALQATGGPSDPAAYDADADAYDPQVWGKVATVTTLAARGLAENSAFMPENMSVRGSVELAGATALALPHLTDTTVIEYNSERAEREGAEPTAPGRQLPGMRGTYELPNVSRQAFGELIAGATATPESSGVLAGGARAHQEVLTVLAREGVSPDRMIERNVFLQGMIDGAEHGGEAGVAQRKDEAAERVIETVSSTVSSAVPGVAGSVLDKAAGEALNGLTKSVLKAAISKGADWGIDQGVEWASDTWTGNLDRAEREAEFEADIKHVALGRTIDSFGHEFGVYPDVVDDWEDLTRVERDAAVTEYRDRLFGFYDLAYQRQYHDAAAGQTDNAKD